MFLTGKSSFRNNTYIQLNVNCANNDHCVEFYKTYLSINENNFEDFIIDIKIQTKTFQVTLCRWRFDYSFFSLPCFLIPNRTEERNGFFFHGVFLGRHYYSLVYTYSTWLSQWRHFHHSVLSLSIDYHRILLICFVYNDSEERHIRVQLF